MGVSIDSVFSHSNWGKDLGGISFPLLSDFQPKGALASSLGVYLDGPGITDRATVVIDANGVVQYIEAVGPPGRRDIGELAAICEKINGAHSGATSPMAASQSLPADATLYVKNSCGPSRATLAARANLHLTDSLTVKNINDDAAAKAELEAVAGKDQAPCLVAGGKAMHESADIVAHLVSTVAPL